MLCKKCKKEIPDGSLYCNLCGRKQTVTAAKHRKRAHGTGTIRKDTRYKNPYIAIAPSSPNGAGRIYLGSYPDVKSAQEALDDFIKKGRPDLYSATLEDIYKLWSTAHYKQIADATVYKAMWKRLEPIHRVRMSEIRAAHFQPYVDAATSKSAASKIKSLALMLCRYAVENDIVAKNYADFIKMPKFDKTEKVIFSADQLGTLWLHSSDKRIQVILAMIYMGFRLGEVIILTPESVHLDEGYVIGGIKTEAGKNRIVPFPSAIPEVKDFFRGWLQGAPPKKPLFDMTERQFRHAYFYQPLSELGMIDGQLRQGCGNSWVFPDKHHLTPHSTRHTFASLSAAAGMKPENLQKIIGHADYSTTADIYIHKDISELITEMSKLRK